MTIFQILKDDHKKIKALLKKIEKTDEEQPEKRKKLFDQFKKILVAHAKSEEKAVYDRLKSKEKTRPLSFEGYEEHALVDLLVEQLTKLDKSSEVWTAKATVVKELLEHHIKEEEDEMFKKMNQAFDSESLKKMGKTMTSLEKSKLK